MAEVWVDDLFRIRGRVKVGGKVLYLRTVTAAEDADRAEYALTVSKRVMLDLADKKSGGYKALSEYLSSLTRDGLEAECLARQTRQLTREAARVVLPEASLEPPHNASLVDTVELSIKQDAIDEDTIRRRIDWVQERAEAYKKELAGLKKAELMERARRAQIEARVELAYLRALNNFTLYAACFEDEELSVRAFGSPEEVAQLGSWAHDQLTEAYYSLDRFSREPEALKNLPSCQPHTD